MDTCVAKPRSKYKKICLQNGEKRDQHRVVMENHLGRRLTFNEVVHHKKDDRYCNDIENLELMTRAAHGRLHGKDYKKLWEGEKSKTAKLNANMVRHVRKLSANGCTFQAIADDFSVDRCTISKIIRGMTYRNVEW